MLRSVLLILSAAVSTAAMSTAALPACLPAGAPSAAPLPPSPPSYGVEIKKTWIPMRDGVRLAATLYMPAGGKKADRFPALLEYLPYRKDDDEAIRDYGEHTYFAKRGFVGARVDIRGFGNSEGVPPEREYSAQEQKDAEQVIAWLARQPWSNGKVGMLGISWGGFSAIQIALRRPPALKAILAAAATEELFKEDVHYMDGVFHVDEFELTMDLDQGRTGAPDFNLDEAVIGPRMDSTPWSLNYMRHQRDGEFWRAPLRPIDALTVPAFLIGGLQDGYRDSIPRMLERVKAPLKAWIGPWNHGFRTAPITDRSTSGETRRFAGSTTGSKGATPACDRSSRRHLSAALASARVAIAECARRVARGELAAGRDLLPRCICSPITTSPR